ncbi:siderophore-interacting protein [Salipiger sp. PrR002]|uniref:siderophore-interacting protein n=1 Tax=Salipiger sp. PrR002 TaxID=2706489 RepID=UPI0013B6DB13|nr:siderophore-interacting protein [Salipiger sp. PrR002]NDW00709.1 siderophore-interacting protein [Salipiger sp. PrR002]NDW57696.1 siderophore-interacting protein [Salipiger sp. PrR004]
MATASRATTSSRFDGPLPAQFVPDLRARLDEYGIPYEHKGRRLKVNATGAEVALRVDRRGFDVEIAADGDVPLHQWRETVNYMLDQLLPDAGARMAWSGVGEAKTPPNFHLATVIGTRRITPNFLRIEMACDGIEALSEGGMHFSLLLPPEDTQPRWPELTAQGRTIWPDGACALHRAAYTFVWLDAARGRFAFDIFEHEGGRTTHWARQARPGTTVGVMGPGGGDFPKSERLLLAGDETALPAIRRILESAPAGTQGRVMIETGSQADRPELAYPSGMHLSWVPRGVEGGLGAALARITEIEDGLFVWVAAEKSIVRAAKAQFKDLGLPRERGYFSAYWISG